MRGIDHDAAYIASVASQLPGPVLLVGHSYGGAVITNAGSRADNVRGLVYVGAFIPDEGETLQNLADQATDSKVLPALRPTQYPTWYGVEPGAEFTIDPASFHEVFCADLPAEQAAILAVSQRPLAGVSFGEPTQDPAWKTLPTWAVISPSDFVIGPAGERFMAERAGRHDHRGRGLARHDDLAAPGDCRRDPDRGRRGLVTSTARSVCAEAQTDRGSLPHQPPRLCHGREAGNGTTSKKGTRMKIVVIGGTGLIGSKVVALLTERGHEAVAASPRLGVNTLTGEGLADALAGASVVVDVSNAPSFEDQAVLTFFETSTRNLLAAEAAAGVGHHVALSVVGTERLAESGYFRAKIAQETLITSSSDPLLDRACHAVLRVHHEHRRCRHGRRHGAPVSGIHPAHGGGRCRQCGGDGCPRSAGEWHYRGRGARAVPPRRPGSARAQRPARSARGDR